VNIDTYEYEPTDLDLATQVPTVKAGEAITFNNLDAPAVGDGTWHSITACAAPCNQTTGVAYPLADGPIEFDSGQLGNFGQPTSGHLSWTTPADLPAGTYTFFCRVHPFMRGAFRVLAADKPPKHHHDHGHHHHH
jgi:plastocyanin